MTKIKYNTKIIFFIVIFFSLLSCQKKQPQNVVEILVPKTISSLPILELDGEIIKGKLIKTVFFQDHIIAMADFVRNTDKLIFTGFTQGLAHHHNNPEVKIACTAVWGVSSLLSHNPDLKSLTDFKGKTISVPFAGSPLELQLKAMLRKQDLIGKVRLRYLPIQQSIPFLLQKKVDGICVPEPVSTKLITENKAIKVFSFADKWGILYQGQNKSPQVSLFMKNSFYLQNRNFYQNLLNQIDKNIADIQKNPEQTSEKYTEAFNLSKPALTNSIKNTLFALPDYPSALKISQMYLNQIQYMKKPDKIFYLEYKNTNRKTM